MYEDLIQRLEGKVFERPSCTPFDCGVFGLVGEAAAAIAALQSENAEKDKEIERLRKENERLALNGGRYMTIAEQRYELYSHALDTIEKRETERDTLRDSVADFIVENADCLKIAIDTQDRHYLGVLIAQWRGAQGEG